MTNKVFIGFFLVDGQPDSVEVPLTGNGNVDRAALAKAIRDRHPKASTIVPNGTRFGTRSEDAGFIETSEGMVLRNIFPHDDKNPANPSRVIGRVFYSGTPYEVVLLYQRAPGYITIALKPRVNTHGPVKFPNQLHPQLPLHEFPAILAEILGRDARSLELDIREK